MTHSAELIQTDRPYPQRINSENLPKKQSFTNGTTSRSLLLRTNSNIIRTGRFPVENNIKNSSRYIDDPSASIQELQKNEMLAIEGDSALYYYEIIFGHVKTYTLLNDGRCLITNFLRKGDFFGLPYEEIYSLYAQAISRSNVRRYSYSEMNEIIAKSPEFTKKILSISQKEISNAKKHMVLLGRKSPEEKIASFLLSCENWPTKTEGFESTLYLPMPLTDIADHLGLAKETVCRVLSKFKRTGLIKNKEPRTSCELFVRDLDQLNHYA